MENNLPVSIIIFGASGDLTQRKLVPSLFNLYRKGRMPKRFRMVGYGGTAFTDEQFRTHLQEGMKQFASFKYTDEEWNNFASNLAYHQGRYDNPADFEKLNGLLKDWEAGA
jgi:glucose-6-phosphate 1-dehydrogenase